MIVQMTETHRKHIFLDFFLFYIFKIKDEKLGDDTSFEKK
jgi:hypothetical protein